MQREFNKINYTSELSENGEVATFLIEKGGSSKTKKNKIYRKTSK